MKFAVALLLLAGLPMAAVGQTSIAPKDPPPPGITATGKGVATASVTTALVRVIARGVTDEAQLLTALKSAGVEDASLDKGGSNGYGAIAVRGRLSNATPAKLDAITQAVRTFAQAHPPTPLLDVHFYGPAADCPAIEQRAREAALADARRRAGALATSARLRLGDQVAVAETGGCPQVGPSGGANAIDATTISMRVLVNETVTFAIAK